MVNAHLSLFSRMIKSATIHIWLPTVSMPGCPAVLPQADTLVSRSGIYSNTDSLNKVTLTFPHLCRHILSRWFPKFFPLLKLMIPELWCIISLNIQFLFVSYSTQVLILSLGSKLSMTRSSPNPSLFLLINLVSLSILQTPQTLRRVEEIMVELRRRKVLGKRRRCTYPCGKSRSSTHWQFCTGRILVWEMANPGYLFSKIYDAPGTGWVTVTPDRKGYVHFMWVREK